MTTTPDLTRLQELTDRFEAVRTTRGWRFSRVEATRVWSSGELPSAERTATRSARAEP